MSIKIEINEKPVFYKRKNFWRIGETSIYFLKRCIKINNLKYSLTIFFGCTKFKFQKTQTKELPGQTVLHLGFIMTAYVKFHGIKEFAYG